MNICEQCGYYLKISSSDRIELSVDPGTWDPMDDGMVSLDPIEFHSEEEPYKDRLTEAVQTGTGQLNGIPVAIGVMDFQFMGGSMGSVVGEKITRLIEYATNKPLPLILKLEEEDKNNIRIKIKEDLAKQSIRIEVKEGIYARRVLYMEIRGLGDVPLTRTDENLTPREIEQKAAELAYFLRVPIENASWGQSKVNVYVAAII
ncbi:hypothetical protein Ddye_032582 [Dipteronia dyeriana]|uniref:Photosystem I assembly protein Ycf4 n=1 Tax=Dipteronia dyeriana TaxID=168575 RepID=A0AAD9TD16_9ROSI|nr:hypothetical protein Ddye_032582 [Dipteronia dyeriana]